NLIIVAPITRSGFNASQHQSIRDDRAGRRLRQRVSQQPVQSLSLGGKKMKITGFHGRIASVLGLAVALGLTAGAASAQQRLAMGGTHGNSAFYAYQVAVVSDWNKVVPGVNISVQELGGASASTTALMRGEVDMGIAVTSSDF